LIFYIQNFDIIFEFAELISMFNLKIEEILFDKFPRYRLIKRLGVDSFGQVYSVLDTGNLEE